MRRRDFLATTIAATTFSLFPTMNFAQETTAKKILFYSRSQGFEHTPVKLDKNGDCVAGLALQRLGKELGYDVDCTKDGTIFDGDLDQYAAFIFYTSGDLDKEGGDGQKPMSKKGFENLQKAIRTGTGFLGFHSATDTWRHNTGYKNDAYYEMHEYIRLLGGEFISHGEQQEATIEIVDDTLPSLKKRTNWRHFDEWYTNKNFAPDMHVLASLQTAGMKTNGHNGCYDRPAFPCIWTRNEKNGVVMYCALGHNDSFWSNGESDDLLIDLIKTVLGQIKVSETPNLTTSCPGANKLQNSWDKGLKNTSD